MGSGAGMIGAAFLAALSLALPAQATAGPLVIAHRGASAERPEHTLAAYERAIDQGADYIEPDLVPTKDGVLVARHENEISGTTDIADRPEFAARKATRFVDGQEVTGWFTEDLALAELQTLRARERLPQVRPGNTAFDGFHPVPTLAEVIALVKAKEAETGRSIGIYPELKHPSYFAERGIDVASLLLSQLGEAGYGKAGDPVFIQSFEVGVLERLDGVTPLRLVQLVASRGGPADRPGTTYAQMLTPDGLREVAGYADAIGASFDLIVEADGAPRPLTALAHEAGLAVHAWTVRPENAFLPARLRNGDDPAAPGDMAALYCDLVRAGVDGVFIDAPAGARVDCSDPASP